MRAYSKTLFKNTAILLLAVALVSPSFFMAAKPAEAQIGLLGCIAGMLGIETSSQVSGGVQGVSESTPKAPIWVPVTVMGDLGLGYTQGATRGSARATAWAAGGVTFKECVLDPLLWLAKQVIIEQLTSSIVAWINSGFEGGPTFVTDPFGFFMNMGDIIAGEYIAGGGLDFLCSPFQLEVQLALIFEYYDKQQSRDNAYCTLSSISGNVTDFFGGVFDQVSGWDSWFEVVTKPGNDPMGAYLHAEAEMSARIRSKNGEELDLLAWANGAFSIRDAFGNVETPGSYINNQLNEVTTRAGIGQLQIADEVDEILGALISQISQQLLSGGLFAATSPNPTSVNPQSLVQQLQSGSNASNLGTTIQNNIAAATAQAVAAGNTPVVAQLNALNAQVSTILASSASNAVKAGQLNAINYQVQTIASQYLTLPTTNTPTTSTTPTGPATGGTGPTTPGVPTLPAPIIP